MKTHYDVLGVTRDASLEEIRRAYRNLAKTFHPDRHAGTPEAVRAHSEQVMATVNEAYHVLSDADRRAEYDRHLAGRARVPDGPRVRPPAVDECVLCGSHPAAEVRLERRVGMLIARQVHRFDGLVCHDCGLALFRSMTSRTLVTGWWGIISFFANWVGLLRNLSAWTRLRKLESPRQRADALILTPLEGPLDPGRPLWLRAGFVSFAVVVAVMIASGVATQEGARTPPSAPASSERDGIQEPVAPTSARDLTGWCLRYGASGQYIEDVVSCGDFHDARVLDVTRSASACPPSSPAYFEIPEQGQTWIVCVDG